MRTLAERVSPSRTVSFGVMSFLPSVLAEMLAPAVEYDHEASAIMSSGRRLPAKFSNHSDGSSMLAFRLRVKGEIPSPANCSPAARGPKLVSTSGAMATARCSPASSVSGDSEVAVKPSPTVIVNVIGAVPVL